MKTQRVEELVLQSLEHELGGVKIYAKAIEEQKHVKTAIGAARAEQAAEKSR